MQNYRSVTKFSLIVSYQRTTIYSALFDDVLGTFIVRITYLQQKHSGVCWQQTNIVFNDQENAFMPRLINIFKLEVWTLVMIEGDVVIKWHTLYVAY